MMFNCLRYILYILYTVLLFNLHKQYSKNAIIFLFFNYKNIFMWFKGTRTLLLVIFSHACTPVTLLNHLYGSLPICHNDFIVMKLLVEKSLLKRPRGWGGGQTHLPGFCRSGPQSFRHPALSSYNISQNLSPYLFLTYSK